MCAHLVAGLALGDGHVRHQVAVVGVPQRRRPAADHHLARAEGLQHGPARRHRGEGAAVLLEGEQPRGEGVLVPVLAQPQHVLRLAPVLPLGVRPGPGPALGLDQPQRLYVGDAFLQLELYQRQDLERNPGVDEGLGTVDTLVSPVK